jgi:hypothetical protein
MMKKELVVALLLSARICLSDKFTQIEGLGPTPKYEVASTDEKIQVDGHLFEKAWVRASPITLIFPWGSQTGKKQKTVVKILRDRDTLYVGYECVDSDITAIYKNRDDPVYKDDCVEIFIKPSEETDSYFGMEMNCLGVLFDYFYPFPEELDKTLDFVRVQLKTDIRGTLNKRDDQDQGWSLEVGIPFKNFSKLTQKLPPAPGDRWRVQINRWDGVGDQKARRLSMWCHSGLKDTDPHNPERFGTLIFK